MLDCVICLNKINESFKLQCQHSFCSDCINNWLALSNKCPLCTQIVSDNNIIYQNQSYNIEPCLDFSQQIKIIQKRLQYSRRQIESKQRESQNIKSSISKIQVMNYFKQLQQIESLFDIFCISVVENTKIENISELLETLKFKLIDLESILAIQIQNNKSTSHKLLMVQDYEEDFPELEQKQQKINQN